MGKGSTGFPAGGAVTVEGPWMDMSLAESRVRGSRGPLKGLLLRTLHFKGMRRFQTRRNMLRFVF